MAHNAFDTALEVLADGWSGQEAVEEWMARVTASGERFCPIAYEILLASAAATSAQEAASQSVSGGVEFLPDPLFDGQLVFDEIPAEPVQEGELF